MKYTETCLTQGGYEAPCVRVVEMRQEISFLQSNLEPIDGGDDPEIEW